MNSDHVRRWYWFRHPLWLALLIQLGVLLCLQASASWWVGWIPLPHYAAQFLVWQTLWALLISRLLGLPRWWLWIQTGLPIGVYWGAVQTLIDPAWFAILAVFLMLIFSAVLRERVPLYLSNRYTQQALQQLAQTHSIHTAVDLGSGLGGVVRALAAIGVRAQGVEYSPLLAWLSAYGCRWLGLGQIIRADMWQVELGDFDLVYVFLSPQPMSRLWQKAQAEMRAGSLFVSNSFAIDSVVPEEIWQLNDRRQTQLYIYRIPERAEV